jgi:hypothetical protein
LSSLIERYPDLIEEAFVFVVEGREAVPWSDYMTERSYLFVIIVDQWLCIFSSPWVID